MEPNTSPIPPLLLERAALGEFDAAELTRLQKRFGPRFDERVAELVAQNESWAQDGAHNKELKQIENLAGAQQEPQGRRSWFVVPAVVAMACVALVVVLRPESPDPKPNEMVAMASEPKAMASGDPSTRLKGLSPYLTLHRKTDKGQERLAPNAMAKQGDVIQLSYVAAGAKFGVIVSIDGVGQTTLHFPNQAKGGTALRPDIKVPLNHAYELDNAPDFEKFYFVSYSGTQAPDAFVDEVLRRAKAIAKSPAKVLGDQPLPLPAQWSQFSFLLRKPRAGH